MNFSHALAKTALITSFVLASFAAQANDDDVLGLGSVTSVTNAGLAASSLPIGPQANGLAASSLPVGPQATGTVATAPQLRLTLICNWFGGPVGSGPNSPPTSTHAVSFSVMANGVFQYGGVQRTNYISMPTAIQAVAAQCLEIANHACNSVSGLMHVRIEDTVVDFLGSIGTVTLAPTPQTITRDFSHGEYSCTGLY